MMLQRAGESETTFGKEFQAFGMANVIQSRNSNCKEPPSPQNLDPIFDAEETNEVLFR
jgi:hypothetical protein